MQSFAFDANCPTRTILESISKKWSPLLLMLLIERPHRFGELKQGVSGISQKVLAQTLRMLERNGIVRRTVDSTTVPISVVYALTELGESLAGPIGSIRQWAEQYSNEVVVAQRRYDKGRAADTQDSIVSA